MKGSHLLLVLLLIIFGAINTTLLTLQNHQLIPDAKPNNKFFHPFMQTVVVMFAEALCFIPYIFYKLFKPKKNQLQASGFMKPDCPWYLPVIPGIFDLISSILAYIALNLVSGSVWQISRGGVIITTAIFSKICLSKKFTKSAILGCFLAFIGITLVQIFEITLSDKSNSDQTHTTAQQILGIILLFVSLFFATGAFIVQKMIFNKYIIHPFKMVFIEGMVGFFSMAIVVAILSVVPCPNIPKIQQKCLAYKDNLYIESVPVFFEQISKNFVLLAFIIGSIFSFGIAVPLGVTVSKVINPVSRSLADVCRTVLIWGFCLFLTYTIGQQDDQYKLQITGILLNLLKLFGFLLVIIGTMIYHDIIKIFKQKPQDIQESLLLSENDIDIVDHYNRSTASLASAGSGGKKSNPGTPNQRQSLM